ncbi:prepilin-type N-terminal cleavage/methylation domain-containing protein [Sinimarinibacterium sp. NLF-5-8]|uniref:prepilin-type N-terminal cleavage/methylation domain-containing protein n=1 Tax=Sinimarinibacterium sp. NLF-5-8 TaxID=2698684 RepID=UPI00137BABCB|nr:prepilin-type N-terminal cleavage/methylation domain-containing protein [Sinimarinibacterium sp. NLF-5-8]QHS09123.1 prepilin-type N-terminal cleavage/methylation domain-containing protein [Sinimarinibacterium sp. NLF-5-8]
MRPNRSSGFTLMELMVVVATLGILALAIAPYFDTILVAQSRAYQLDQDRINRSVAFAMRDWAGRQADLGLPAPYTNAGQRRFSTIMDTNAAGLAELLQFIQDRGVTPFEINDDGTNMRRVRVYQRLTGLTSTSPLFGTSGPNVTLRYSVGAIYSTRCEILDGTCNLSPRAGDSPALTSANQATWQTTGTDSQAIRISTLGLEQERQRVTAYRLNRVRDQFRAFATAQLLAAPPGSTSNFLPGPSGGGANTQGCWHAWIDLQSSNMLDTVGLGKDEFGVTAWGGRVEYCRDYDTAGAGANTLPHVGALRINRSLSTAAAPAGAVAQNAFLTF